MRALIASLITDKSDMWVLGNDDLIYHISEGTGDALSPIDLEEGFVDYIYIDVYKNNLSDVHDDNIFDGGFLLLKTLYADTPIDDILAIVEQYYDVKFFTIDDSDWNASMEEIENDLQSV